MAVPSYGQGDVRDTSIFMVPITASYAFQIPGGDMAERFGANNNIGLSAAAKFRSNFMIGLEGGFIFGNRVDQPGLLRGLVNDDNEILDQEGQPATVFLFERGYTVMVTGAKIIPVVGPNPNSGIMVKLGLGYMRHKIRIESQNNVIPQLEGDYLEGYDRLSAGPAGMFFFGYQHFSSNRLLNFTFGFEMQLGLTEPLRAYNFDTMTRDTDRRYDALSGFRVGWTLPIYRRSGDQFYFY